MDSNVLSALIGVAGIILGAFVRPVREYVLFKIKIAGKNIPNLVGHWKVEWFVPDGEGGWELYSKDTIDIEKQRGFNVSGKGREDKGTYLLTGKLSMSNILSFTYEFENPRIISTGGGILQIDPLGKTGTGLWYGFTKQNRIEGGEVIWKRA